MSEKTPVIVMSPHPDDWQIFAGASLYAHLRDPESRVAIIVLTAGDAGDETYHWTARHSGALLSLLRALPSWNPYARDVERSSGGFSVSYETLSRSGKSILRTVVRDAGGIEAEMYALHLYDGGTAGDGFAPRHQSLSALEAGAPALGTVWPSNPVTRYASWDELRASVTELVREVIGSCERPVALYAPDPDPARNPGDHPDHSATGRLAIDVCAAIPQLAPVWIAMYDIANRPENLDASALNEKRAAIYAYGGGYTAQAAGERGEWRHGWEREFPVYGPREYLTRER